MGNIADDILAIVAALTPLIVALDVFWTRHIRKDVRKLNGDVVTVRTDVKELKNGELKSKVKEALNEYAGNVQDDSERN